MFKHYPLYPSRPSQLLDGLWDFALVDGCPDPSAPDLAAVAYTDRLPVPGTFDTLPKYAARRGTAFYRTRVRATPNTRMMLRCGGLGIWGAFFWDGRRIGIQDLPYSGMSFVFDSGDGEEHELVAVVDNRFDFQRSPLLSQYYDYYCFGGIYRSVEVHEIPGLAIDRATVRTLSLDGRVRVSVRFHETDATSVGLSVRFDGGKARSLSLPVADGVATFEATLENAMPWSPESPALHTVEIVADGGDSVVERFGLRTVETRDRQILLNGAPLRLRGYCRHETHPDFGPALPEQILLQDVQLLLKTGCNFVRGTHYPQDQRFLDLCDENGLLVWEETVGWGDGVDHLADPGFEAAQLRQPAWMVRNSANHPCVILWGFLNEGHSNRAESRKLYTAMVRELKALDGSRPVTYASMFGTRDLNFDLADVVSYNTYPGWYANDREALRPLGEIAPRFDEFIAWLDANPLLSDKPFIISEIGAGAIYGWRDRFRAHWSEEYQADYLDEILTYFDGHPRINGISLWQFCDGRTYATARALYRPRAFNNKGLFDEYRRPKLAFDVVQRHFAPKA